MTTPCKAKLYRTARLTKMTQKWAAYDKNDGFVRTVFHSQAYNAVTRRQEAIYSCFSGMDEASFIGDFFEYALQDFALRSLNASSYRLRHPKGSGLA